MFELLEPNYIQEISSELNFKNEQTTAVLELTKEGATVPFISRYRKEKTGNLDENQIRDIIDLQKKLENIFDAKKTATNTIIELGKMTQELFENIKNAKTLKEVEELYKPYKSKKKTKAMLALEKGFGVVAESLKQNKIEVPENLLKDYSFEEIIDGAIEIVGAEVNANSNLRHKLIEELKKYGSISSSIKSEKMLEKLNEKDKEQIPKFDIYKDFQIKLSQIKPYQVLALNRGENLNILTIKIEKDDIIYDKILSSYKFILNTSSNDKKEYIKKIVDFIPELSEAFKRGYENLFSSVENEIRGDLKELAEDDSIKTFQTNLKALLLTKPESCENILSIDPGFRVGCKLCVIDKLGNPKHFDKIYLHNEAESKFKLKDIFKKYQIDKIVIGNGTACQETSELIFKVFSEEKINLEVFIVNESGASVYSVSKTAEEEFPNLDSLDRGTISIGRRFLDPLSELVKVPVGSIGVGMYQHDIAEKKLEEKLGNVVVDAVNEVGINVNSASIYVLNYISGIDKRVAKKIYENRPYKSRKDLQKIVSQKVFEQSAGFLRVPNSEEKLDNTDIHPEQYELAKYIIENNIKNNQIDDKIKNIYPDVTTETIDFIINSYSELGVEKRKNSTHTKAKSSSSELKEGDILEGIVRNVVAFGAFVDIGSKNDGLVHISQLSNTFVKNPMDVVKVGDKVKVKITKIEETGKIQLTMKDL